MSNYRPGTLDDSDALKRRLGEIDRTAREANKPTGSNAYGTTAKMQFLDEGFGQYAVPVHGIVWMTTDTPPSEAGYVGQWRLIAQTFLVMTDYPSKLYLYERIS